MRYFHLNRHKYHCPTVNLDKLWTLVSEQTRLVYKEKTDKAPVIDCVRAVSTCPEHTQKRGLAVIYVAEKAWAVWENISRSVKSRGISSEWGGGNWRFSTKAAKVVKQQVYRMTPRNPSCQEPSRAPPFYPKIRLPPPTLPQLFVFSIVRYNSTSITTYFYPFPFDWQLKQLRNFPFLGRD